MIRFILDAVRYGCAYIDCDGCILYRMQIGDEARHLHFLYAPPGTAFNALEWWKENLAPTPIVYHRLALLYVLRALGVRLVLWTNRAPQHEAVTRTALGRHAWLFSEMQFHDGKKAHRHAFIGTLLPGPVMDDQKPYIYCGTGRGYPVKQL